MPWHTIEVDRDRLTLIVRDPARFKAAEMVVTYSGLGEHSNEGDYLIIRCTNVEDLSQLGAMLSDKID